VTPIEEATPTETPTEKTVPTAIEQTDDSRPKAKVRRSRPDKKSEAKLPIADKKIDVKAIVDPFPVTPEPKPEPKKPDPKTESKKPEPKTEPKKPSAPSIDFYKKS
jgi:colicin import membrane protein